MQRSAGMETSAPRMGLLYAWGLVCENILTRSPVALYIHPAAHTMSSR